MFREQKKFYSEGDNPPTAPDLTPGDWLVGCYAQEAATPPFTKLGGKSTCFSTDWLEGDIYDEKIMLNLLNHVINEYVHIYNMYNRNNCICISI